MTRRPSVLLAAAGGCAGLFLLLLVAAYGSDAARRADATSLLGFVAVEPNGGSLPELMGHFGDPGPVIFLGAVLAAVAALRGRPRVGAVIVLLIGITSISSQVLKAVLAYPRFEGSIGRAHVAPEAFPSGHSTAAMAVALSLVIAVPSRLRPLAALVGAGFALGVAFSVIALGWHFPSDAVGGFVLASGWALVLLAGLAALDERFPARTGRSRAAASVRKVTEGVTAVGLVALAAAGVLALLLMGLVALAQPGGLVGVAERHTGLVIVAPSVALAAVVLLSGFALLSRKR
ncbi:MAG TPA: phosphatase PAP2 family protein [Thermoleophilaceae bacterium]|nr:phosphatase PAP2 family protein [Thermoleophilaceae bacterium]